MNELMKKGTLIFLAVPSAIMVILLSSSASYILQEYSQYSASLATMLLTIPNLTIIGLILSPILIKYWPVKKRLNVKLK